MDTLANFDFNFVMEEALKMRKENPDMNINDIAEKVVSKYQLSESSHGMTVFQVVMNIVNSER